MRFRTFIWSRLFATALQALIFAIFVDVHRPRRLVQRIAIKTGLEINEGVPWISVSWLKERGTAVVHDFASIERRFLAAFGAAIEACNKTKIKPASANVFAALIKHMASLLIGARDLKMRVFAANRQNRTIRPTARSLAQLSPLRDDKTLGSFRNLSGQIKAE